MVRVFLFCIAIISGLPCYSQQKKFDCKVLDFIINDSVAKEWISSIKRPDRPLIFNDRKHYFDTCSQTANGRKIIFYYDQDSTEGQMIHDPRLKSAIYLCNLFSKKNLYTISLYDPSTGTILVIKFKKKKEKYIAYDYNLSWA